MPYTYSRPTAASFTGKGLLGYTFGPLDQKDLEIYYVEVEKGHDVFMISKKITRTYYVISGDGYFVIDKKRYDVSAGMLMEVPPRVEYCYSGKMKILVLSRPRWFSGNDTFTKWNPDVVQRDSLVTEPKSWLTRVARAKMLGKSPVSAYLRINQRLWKMLPLYLSRIAVVRSYGDFLHKLARARGTRAQALATLFLRNKPELELIRRLVISKSRGETLRVAVLGCSTGAEAYSIAWKIRSARPDLKVILHAVDISKEAVEVAKCGLYSLKPSQLTGTQVCECVTSAEMAELFDREGDTVAVKSWIQEGINWHVNDAGEPDIIDTLGPQDIVVANNFLCHMEPLEAERCLRNIARLVSASGHLFVSGIDLDVRTKVAQDLGWEPVQELLEEIHEGDPYLMRYWPSQYAGLEPLNKRRRDWKLRYAAAFQLVPLAISSAVRRESVQSVGGRMTKGPSLLPRSAR